MIYNAGLGDIMIFQDGAPVISWCMNHEITTINTH